MNSAIEKFIKYLEELLILFESNIDLTKKINKRMQSKFKNPIVFSFTDLDYKKRDIIQLLTFLKSNEKDILESWNIYASYDALSMNLEDSNLNVKEKMEIIMYIVSKNCAVLFVDQESLKVIFDAVIFKNLYAPEMDMDIFEKFITTLDIETIIGTDDNLLTKKEEKIKKCIIQTLKQTKIENKKFLLSNQLIKKHYLDKKED